MSRIRLDVFVDESFAAYELAHMYYVCYMMISIELLSL